MMAAASKGDGEESCGAGCTTDGATSSEGVGEATEITEGGGGGGGRGKQNHKAADNKNVASAADNKAGIPQTVRH